MADKLRGGSTVGGNIIWHAGNSNSALANWTANNIIATSVSATTFNGALSGNASTATSSVSVTGTQAAAITANTAKVSNVSTNLSYTTAATTGTVVSSDGTNAVIPAATTTVAGLMTGTDKTKLNGIASGATANAGTVTSVSGSGSLTGTVTTSGSISHLATDGHLHVPVTSTTNSGKVLTAGATAGSLSWQTPTVGTVTSVVAGNGMTQTGTSTINPTLNVVSHAGTAGTIGTINVGADALGVNLGTTSTTAARGDHTHNYAGSASAGGSATTALACTGNAATATKLATARTINGVSFNGSANITVGVGGNNITWGTANTAGNLYTGITAPTGTTRLNYSGYFYPTYINLTGSADTATAATHYYVETGSDGYVRPKTLANVKTEIVTKAAVEASLTGAITSHTHSYLPLAGGTVTGDLTVNGGDIILGGTGRIQGIDTVSASTDAASKAYVDAAGGATGGGTDKVFVENGQVVSSNYTITSGKNAMSAGDITINTGITVTIPTGSRWVIV